MLQIHIHSYPNHNHVYCCSGEMPTPVSLPSIKRQKELEEEEHQQMMKDKPSVSLQSNYRNFRNVSYGKKGGVVEKCYIVLCVYEWLDELHFR